MIYNYLIAFQKQLWIIRENFDKKRKKGNKGIFYNPKVSIVTPSIMPIIKEIITWIITATIAIRNAFIQPQSKKCLIKPNHIINDIIEPIIPDRNAPSSPPMTAPSITIHIASVNFAFSGPTNALPASHTNNEFTMMLITTAISKYAMFDISSANFFFTYGLFL